jgi:hypothetical protein
MAGDAPLRVVAEFSSYEGMLDALRARVAELNVNGERFDEYAGLPRGYLSKLVGARPVRRIGMCSFEPLLRALGLKCCFIVDDAATQRLRDRVQPRNGSFARAVYTLHTLTDRKWRRIQKIGRQARWKKLTKAERSEIMRAVRAAQRARPNGRSST